MSYNIEDCESHVRVIINGQGSVFILKNDFQQIEGYLRTFGLVALALLENFVIFQNEYLMTKGDSPLYVFKVPGAREDFSKMLTFRKRERQRRVTAVA